MQRNNNVKDLGHVDHLATMAGHIVSQLLQGHEARMVTLLEPIESGAAQLQADTPRAALFQLLLAAADLGELTGTVWDQDALTHRHKRIEALVISALNVFERHCKLDRSALGGDYFARRDYVPQAWQRPAAGVGG